MLVRTAQVRDLDSVARISRELAIHVGEPDPGNDTVELKKNLLGNDRWAECMVVVDSGDIVAFAIICRQFEAHTRNRNLWLSDLAVQMSHQGRGIGQIMIKHLKDYAMKLGCRFINFELWTENQSARPFYKRLGATADEEIELQRIPVEPS